MVGAQSAHGDSLTDAIDTRSLAVGEARRANATGASSTILNPSGLALNRELGFEGSYAFLPDDETSFARASACDSTVPVGGCFYYSYFSSERSVGALPMGRRTHEFGLTSARALTQHILLGINGKYVDANFANEDDTSGFSTDIGLTLAFSQSIQVAAVAYNVLGSLDHSLYPLAFATGLSFQPGSKMLMVNVDALWNQDAEGKKGRYSAGAEYSFKTANQSRYPIRVGGIIDRGLDTRYVTGGLGFTSGKIGFDVAVRSEVSGGDELVLQAGLRFFGFGAN
jgi:hypothetical protein